MNGGIEMIDVDRIKTLMAEKKKSEEQSRREQAQELMEKSQIDEANFVKSVQYHANHLQADIEEAISKGHHSISVFSDHFISHLLDRRRHGNMFFERYSTPYSRRTYENPFYALYESLDQLGMKWQIQHTDASRDPEYQYDAYDMLVLVLPRVESFLL